MAVIKDLGGKWAVEVGTYRGNSWSVQMYRTFYEYDEAFAFYKKFNPS